jgi:hypothetical protein
MTVPFCGGHMLGLRLPELVVFVIPLLVLYLFVILRLVGKTGHSAWLGLLFLVPLVNVGFILYLAFTVWPIQKELNRLREQTGNGRG